ncbi:MAG: hypothetical protein LBN08_00775 [Lactobacillales bacterium]|jgi:peptidoglycan hydrolase CwlO-like protein|nr:hypothetical protein [Lactobacillales bacterium]
MKKPVKQIMNLAALAALAIGAIAPVAAYADDLDDLIHNSEAKLGNLSAAQKAAKAEMEAAQKALNDLNAKVATAKAKVDSQQREYDALVEQMTQLTLQVERRELQINNQAQSIQTNNNNRNLMRAVMNAKDWRQALAVLKAGDAIVKANNEIIIQQHNDMDSLQKMEDGSYKLLNDLNDEKAQLVTQQAQQQAQRDQLSVKVADYAAQIATTEAERGQALAAKEKRRQAEAAAAAAAKAAAAKAAADAAKPKPGPDNSGKKGNGGPLPAGATAAIARAWAEIGTSRPTGWNAQGECFKSVERWFGVNASGGPLSGWANAGFHEIGHPAVGAIMQFTTAGDTWGGSVHTALIYAVHGSTFDVVESNYAGPGLVGTRTGVSINGNMHFFG